MSVLFLVVPLALVVVGAAVAAWVWSARSGQFDDLDTPAVRMLHDDTGEPQGAVEESGQSRPRSRS
jgi:cbb3-type cytochrome oxidase maturation protein